MLSTLLLVWYVVLNLAVFSRAISFVGYCIHLMLIIALCYLLLS